MKCSSPYRRGTWRGAPLRLATARRVLSTDQKERHNQSVLPCEHPPVHLTSCPANGLHPSLNPVIRLDFAVAYLPSSLPDALSPSLPRCSPRLPSPIFVPRYSYLSSPPHFRVRLASTILIGKEPSPTASQTPIYGPDIFLSKNLR